MTHSPAQITARILAAHGLGKTPPGKPWPIYVGSEPTTPDNCVTVFNTTGTLQGRTSVDGEIQGLYGVQIRIRAVTHETGWMKGDAIQTVLAEDVLNEAVTIDGSNYLVQNYARIGDVLDLGDEPTSTRQLFTVNAQVAITPR